jgi:hypothetical protein
MQKRVLKSFEMNSLLWATGILEHCIRCFFNFYGFKILKLHVYMDIMTAKTTTDIFNFKFKRRFQAENWCQATITHYN